MVSARPMIENGWLIIVSSAVRVSKLLLFPSIFKKTVEKSKLLLESRVLVSFSVVYMAQVSRVCDAVVRMSNVSVISSL